jgi:hypothetical protein
MMVGAGTLEVLPLPAASKASFEDHLPREGVFASPTWHTWCPSIIQDEEGLYHLFYSRWRRRVNFTAWLTHCQAAHAVSENPQGPYRHVQTELHSGRPGHWDHTNVHNPKIKKFEDKYWLYYIANTNKEIDGEKLLDTGRTGYGHPLWLPLRNSQRTGVAWSDSLYGPWTRSEKPIIEPGGPILKLTVNPAITRGPKGEYLMIIKGDKEMKRGSSRNQALATGPTPTGPFTYYEKAVIDEFDTEDMSMWHNKAENRWYAVYHAHVRIGMMVSENGYDWKDAEQRDLTTKIIHFDDGTSWVPDRMERPFVLTDDMGRPTHLVVACKKGDRSWNVILKLRRSTAS